MRPLLTLGSYETSTAPQKSRNPVCVSLDSEKSKLCYIHARPYHQADTFLS